MLLVVDDDPRMLSSLVRMLRILAVPIQSAPSGLEALAWISGGGSPAIVISDNSMPGMTGLELLEEIGRRKPEVFRILHTGDARLAVELGAGGMITIVAKPADPELLRRLVWAALKSRPEQAPSLAP